MMTKRRIIAWIALVLFIAIVVNILFIHIYVTESAIIFLLYVIFFFFINNKNSFLYSSTNSNDDEITEDGTDDENNTEKIEGDSNINKIDEGDITDEQNRISEVDASDKVIESSITSLTDD